MKTKTHTPGPWEYRVKLSGSENHRGFAVTCDGNTFIAEVSPRDSDGREGEANARLIAAAPELLETLKHAEWKLRDMADWLTAYAENSQAVSVHAHAEEAAAAIAKAGGNPE